MRCEGVLSGVSLWIHRELLKLGVGVDEGDRRRRASRARWRNSGCVSVIRVRVNALIRAEHAALDFTPPLVAPAGTVVLQLLVLFYPTSPPPPR